MRSRFIRCQALVWHYLESGEKTPLLCLHGIGATADHWTRIAPLLRHRFRIIAPDLPGFGETDPPMEGGHTIDEQVARLHLLVLGLGLDRFFLAGNSMGGQLAATYAARHPGRILGLCLLAPGGVIGARFSPVMKAIVLEEHNPLIIRNLNDFNHLTNLCFYKKPWIPRPVRKFLADQRMCRQDNSLAVFDDLRFFSNCLETIAAMINTPSLILWGRNDQVLDVSGAAVLHGILPDSRLALLDHTGHLPMLEDPAACAGLIQQFIDELDSAGNNSSSWSPSAKGVIREQTPAD